MEIKFELENKYEFKCHDIHIGDLEEEYQLSIASWFIMGLNDGNQISLENKYEFKCHDIHIGDLEEEYQLSIAPWFIMGLNNGNQILIGE